VDDSDRQLDHHHPTPESAGTTCEPSTWGRLQRARAAQRGETMDRDLVICMIIGALLGLLLGWALTQDDHLTQCQVIDSRILCD